METLITEQDLDEIKVWKRRDAFMDLFFQVHDQETAEHSVSSLIGSYRKAEVIWTNNYKGRAYKSDECFLRTYYNYLNERRIKPVLPIKQYSLF